MAVTRRRGLSFDILGQDKTGRAFAAVNRRLGGVATAAGKVTRAFGLMGAGISAVGLAIQGVRVIDFADQIDKLSTRLGASTEALSQYQYVAERTRVRFETLTMAFQRMTRRIAEATQGKGEAREALKELGLEAAALNRLAPDQQFEVLADALMGVAEQGDRVRLAMRLFDSEGVAVLQTMEGGSAAIRALREEADSLGKTLGRDQVDALVRAKDAWTRLTGAVSGAVTLIVAELGPALAAVAEWLADRLPVALSWLKTRWIETWDGILLLIAKVTTAMGRLFTALIPLTTGDLQQKNRDWALSMYEVAEGALAMTSAVQGGLEVNIATVGRFDESLKEHASTWERVKLQSAEAGEEMAKAAEVAEGKLDGAQTAARGVEGAIGRVGNEAISGRLAFSTLGDIAISVLQDIAREAIRTTARLLAMNVALGFAGGGGAGGGGFNAERTSQPGGMGGMARGGTLITPAGGGPDSQLLLTKVSPKEQIDFIPPGKARAAPMAMKVEVNNYSAEPVRVTETATGPRIDIGRQMEGVMAERLRGNPNGPLGKALQEYLGVPGAAPIAR